MKPEDQVLFLATRQNFTSYHQEKLLELANALPIQWTKIYKTAENNGVVPLIHRNFTSNNQIAALIPPELSELYRQYSLKLLFHKQEQANLLTRALKFLQARTIKAIVLKGSALDLLVYDKPWFTIAKDIDLILSTKIEDLPIKDYYAIRHSFYKSGVEYDFYSHHDLDMNGMLPINYEKIWQDSKPFKFQDVEARVLSPEDSLISVCVNSCRKRFFRLKSLLDIAETIEKMPDFDWALFGNRCIEYRCANIIYSALRVTEQTIGCKVPHNIKQLLNISSYQAANIHLIIMFLLKFWSLTFPLSKFMTSNRWAELTLLLPYATYKPWQINYLISKGHLFNNE